MENSKSMYLITQGAFTEIPPNQLCLKKMFTDYLSKLKTFFSPAYTLILSHLQWPFIWLKNSFLLNVSLS